MVFTANANFTVSALGVYGSLYQPEAVGLYDKSGNLLASTTVSNSDPLINGYLFASISPVLLKAGSQYTVVAFTYIDSWYYGGAPSQDPRITFNGQTYLYGSTLAFPSTVGGASTAPAYYGPNFLIGAVPLTDSIQVPGYTITSIAGCGIFECGVGDGGPATSAGISPNGMVVDPPGNLYFADAGGRVRVISPTGTISTVAGGGPSSPFLGDGGPASSATLSRPSAVALDSSGNVYIADTGNNRIRKVSGGTITTIAGGSSGGLLGDGGPATSAVLTSPKGIALDSSGNIFVADTGDNSIRKITTSGIITTVAGNGSSTGPSGDGGAATSAVLNAPTTVSLDSTGNLYVACYNGVIRRVSTTGIITTVAGNGSNNSYGDGGQATSAGIKFGASGMATDPAGDIYIADTNGGLIRVVTAAGGSINSIAGGGATVSSLQNFGYPTYKGSAPAADVPIAPLGVALGAGGKIYVADQSGIIWLLVPSANPVFPRPSVSGMNSASAFVGGSSTSSVALGGWMEIYGSDLAYDTRAWASPDFTGANAPTSLDGTSVSIGGQPAFVSYISASQLNVQVPSNIGTGSQPMVVTTANGQSSTQIINVNPEQPELLSTPAFKINGSQYAVALFSDGVTYVLPTGAIPGVPSRPANQGDTITLYGIGFGLTTPYIPAGQVVGASNSLMLPLTATVGSKTATLTYAGLAPGLVGLFQFNLVVPISYTQPTAAQLTLSSGASVSLTLSLSVQ